MNLAHQATGSTENAIAASAWMRASSRWHRNAPSREAHHLLGFGRHSLGLREPPLQKRVAQALITSLLSSGVLCECHCTDVE